MEFGLRLKQINKNFKRPKTTFENIVLSMLLCQKRKERKEHSKDIDYFLKISRGYLRPNYLQKQASKLKVFYLLKRFL